jgi:acyl-CoA synthetase (AMP-forming)/AMP-acid ligase II
MALTVADLVEHSVDAVPDRVAMICGTVRRTYAELEARANRLAHHLAKHGVGKGSHVGIYTANTMETIETMLAVTKLRAVAVNVNHRYTENELRYLLGNADVVALVHQQADSAKVAAVLPDLPLLRHVIVVAGDGGDGGDGANGGSGAEDHAGSVRDASRDDGQDASGDDGQGVSEDDGQGESRDDGQGEGLSAVRSVAYEDALAGESPERDFGPRDPGDLYLLYTGGTTGRP